MENFTFSLEKGMQNLSSTGGFLTVKNTENTVNTMTISWGFVGFMWTKPHFITVVRPQRYTKDVLDVSADSFTISIPFDGKLKEELSICGTKSGRDIAKNEIVTFIDAKTVASPIIQGCDLYYECKINLTQQLEGSLMPPFVRQFYEKDFHYLYFGEIVECYS
ncbi:MAG: flavin reductase [Defluviitaleaceae bacterium]|nr:flavin reductase [Defluviitaleaceae bacterium]